jgi:hypothetical protein
VAALTLALGVAGAVAQATAPQQRITQVPTTAAGSQISRVLRPTARRSVSELAKRSMTVCLRRRLCLTPAELHAEAKVVHDGFGKFSRHPAWRDDGDIRERFGECAFAARPREIVQRSSPHCRSPQARERRLRA